MYEGIEYFYYQKRCRVCNKIYYQGEISRAAFENALENPALTVHQAYYDAMAAVIDSVCDVCVVKINSLQK